MEIKIRQARQSDVPDLLRIDAEVWSGFQAAEEMFRSRIKVFPQGQIVAVVEDRVVGSVFTQRINYVEWKDKNFSWNEITDFGTIRITHQPNGTDLYGIGLAVKKEFQGLSISTRLMIRAAQLVLQKNIRAVYIGARMPEYSQYVDISPEDYITERQNGYSVDMGIRIYEKEGFSIVRVLPNYIEDPDSLNYGALVIRKNPFGKLSGEIIGKFISVLGEKALAKILNM